MSQKATVRRMLEEAGDAGVRSDVFLDLRMPRGAARVREIKKELEEAGEGTVTSTPEKQFCRYRIAGLGGEGGPDAARIAHSLQSGESSEAPSLASGDARLFDVADRPLSAFTDAEAA